MSGRPRYARHDSDPSDLRALKVLAIVLPVTAVIVGELVRAHLIDPSFGTDAEHLVSAGLAIVAVLIFTGLMLVGIQRAQQSLIRQNRDLRLASTVSSGLQGDDPADDAIRRTLTSILEATGSASAAVAILDDPDTHAGARTIHVMANAPVDAAAAPTDVALWSGPVLVGRLTLLPAAGASQEPVDRGVLDLIGHELASAIQVRQMLGDLRRRRNESAALYDVALQVTNRQPLVEILGSIRRHARDLLGVDEAAICLSEAASAALRQANLVETPFEAGDGIICVCPTDDGMVESLHPEDPRCPVRDSDRWSMKTSAPLRSSDAVLGDLWVGSVAADPLDARDQELLAGLADLAAIAIVSANLRHREEMAAIVAERERIAREMHDSLAQVLATCHLRLCALERRPEVQHQADLVDEIAALGAMTHEAYIDVREAILGLRESSHADRELLTSLRVYLEKFSHQTGLVGRLETELPDDLCLAPGAEIQVIRVIQEALTNVRKHAGASEAVVRVASVDGEVRLVVQDDGRGFNPTEVGARDDGFGLHAMRERMTLVGGSLSIHSAPGEGTRVVARLPLSGAGPRIPRPVRDDPAESYAHLAG
jgi:nitrate/nitrite-specific signal transduction histidine kinase